MVIQVRVCERVLRAKDKNSDEDGLEDCENMNCMNECAFSDVVIAQQQF